MSRSTGYLFFSLFFIGVGHLAAQGGAPPLPVLNLQCFCDPVAQGRPVATLRWVNQGPPEFYDVQIKRDGILLAIIPADPAAVPQTFVDSGVSPGAHQYELTVLDKAGKASEPMVCGVDCGPPPANAPLAVINGPQRIILPLRDPPVPFVEAIFDGRASKDSRGERALRYFWRIIDGPEGTEIQSPASYLTRIRFRQPGTHVLALSVAEGPDFQQRDTGFLPIEVIPLDPNQQPGGVVELFPIPEELLVAVVGRKFDLPLVLQNGLPRGGLAIRRGPPGLLLEPQLNRLVWTPPQAAAGQTFPITIVALTPGEADAVVLALEIKVVDAVEPVVLYAFPLPPKRDRDGKGDGGGGALSPAPLVIADQGLVEPSLGLELNPLAAGEGCSVLLINADAVDPLDGLQFAPGCGGVGSSGLYFSGSSADKVLDAIENDFTVELWLSAVSAAVPPGGQGYIFSMSEGVADVNWLVRHDGGTTYTAVVRVNNVNEELSVSAAPRADGLINLVFVRQGNQHRFHVNGSFATSRNVPAPVPSPVDASWNTTYQVLLGNSSDEARPFAGRVHLSAIYGEALSEALIAALDELGPAYPASDPGVPTPIAEICPDPWEIRLVDADGTESRSLLPGGGGGGDGGGGMSQSCPEMLRPFEWTVTPLHPSITAALTPVAGEEHCKRRMTITYDEPPAGTRFDLQVTLKVTQVPVRGITRTATRVMTLRLPVYFKRGDANLDDNVDISDALAVILSIYGGIGALPCEDAGDVNDDESLNTADAVYLCRALFLGGPDPLSPAPDCGPDPAAGPGGPGELGCHGYASYCD